MDFSFGFSLHERRQLAQIERELSSDRRLVAMIAVLEPHRTRAWRQMRCLGIRLRHPRPAARYWSAALFLLLLTIAAPVVLVVALGLGLTTMAVITACALPLPPVLLGFVYRRMLRSHG